MNIWKKWRRREDKNPTPSKKKSAKEREENWLEELEETLARMRQEVERRNAAKSEEARRRKKLLEDKKIRQEQILRENQEKLDRKLKKRMMKIQRGGHWRRKREKRAARSCWKIGPR